MRERPILFNGAMVRAILAGQKTQTRRVAKPQPVSDTRFRSGFRVGSRGSMAHRHVSTDAPSPLLGEVCPFGQPGDRLWVREAFGFEVRHYGGGAGEHIVYRATNPDAIYCKSACGTEYPVKWKPGIHMPRHSCRLVLEITAVRVERLQAGDGDTDFESRYLAEGINRIHHGDGAYYSAFRDEPHPQNWNHPDDAFRELWTSTGGDWDSNPWVWVIEFTRAEVAGG